MKKSSIIRFSSLVAVMLLQYGASAQKIVVDAKGKADFKTIQAAINSLPDSSATPRIIFLKKGTYAEKIFIEKSNIVFEGEDRDQTIITQDIARDEWRCDHPDDWGVATMNVNGNDITLRNLTIRPLIALPILLHIKKRSPTVATRWH
jgi:pectinesterase